MKNTKIKSNKQLNDYRVSDWRDVNGLLEDIDDELKEHGLELDVGNNDDDSYWVRIIKRERIKITKRIIKHFNKCDECGKKITQYEYNKNKGFCNACNDTYK